MKRKWILVLAGVLMAAPVFAEEAPAFKTPQEKSSYALGVNIGKNFKQQGIEVDVEVMAKGLKDALSGAKLLMTEEELQATMMAFQEDMKQKQAKIRAEAGEKNQKEGEAFLAENKKKEGVVTLPSGLQYKIVKAGEGKKPAETDTVEVHYRGTLINGTEFDSSYKRGQTATFKLNGVIPGWREALALMPAGSKWQLFVPANLAYGPRGMGHDIGPNATLIFEVELLAVK